KAAAHYELMIEPGGSRCVRLLLCPLREAVSPGGVRPSSGAARNPPSSKPGDSAATMSSQVSAPEDGRTPPNQYGAGSLSYADELFAQRIREADEFYAELQQAIADPDARSVQRQAFAGMIWSKQFYYYDVTDWLKGDQGVPPPPVERKNGRNHDWLHLN